MSFVLPLIFGEEATVGESFKDRRLPCLRDAARRLPPTLDRRGGRPLRESPRPAVRARRRRLGFVIGAVATRRPRREYVSSVPDGRMIFKS